MERITNAIIAIIAITAFMLTTTAMAAEEEAPKQVLFKNIRIFNGVDDRLIKGDVLVEGNLIKSVGRRAKAMNPNALTIDGGGRTLMPGMIDSHVHLLFSGTPDSIPAHEAMRWDQLGAIGVMNARDLLMDGFTTVRDAGAMYDGIKKVVDEGLAPGPRIYPSGGVISQTSGHGDFRIPTQRNPGLTGAHDSNLVRLGLTHIVDGADQVLAATRQNLSQGASQIKLTAGGGISSTLDPLHTRQFLPEEIEAAVRAAADWDTYVLVHAYTPETVIRSLEAGALCIDHGQMMNEEAMKLLVKKGAFLSPNMAALSKEVLQHPVYGKGFVGEKMRAFLDGSKGFVELVNKYKPRVVYNTDVVATDLVASRAIRDNNMWIHGESFGNLNLLRALTSVGGELMALTGKHNPYPGKLGVIEEGAYADIILVDGDPLKDIRVLGARPKMFEGEPRGEGIETIRVIMKDGEIYKNTLPVVDPRFRALDD